MTKLKFQQQRPLVGDYSEEEAFAAFQGHLDNNEISKEDLMSQRPWHNYPWRAHKCKLSVGDVAPNSKVVTLTEKETKLLEVLDQGNDPRPAVVVFGSITSPAFRKMFLKEILEIVRGQRGAVRLVVVYLAEAHPKDGWHLSVNERDEVVVTEHKGICDRINSAKELLNLYPSLEELVCDSIDNDSDHHYEAQSSRIYVIHEKKIVYQSEVGPFQISPSSLEAFLLEWPLLQKQKDELS